MEDFVLTDQEFDKLWAEIWDGVPVAKDPNDEDLRDILEEVDPIVQQVPIAARRDDWLPQPSVYREGRRTPLINRYVITPEMLGVREGGLIKDTKFQEALDRIVADHPAETNQYQITIGRDLDTGFEWRAGEFFRGTTAVWWDPRKLYPKEGINFEVADLAERMLDTGVDVLIIRVKDAPRVAGAYDPHNDCVLRCFRSVKNHLKSNAQIKQRLGLERDDMIPITYLPAIEKLFRVSASIPGVYTTRISDATHHITLAWEDDHCERVESQPAGHIAYKSLEDLQLGVQYKSVVVYQQARAGADIHTYSRTSKGVRQKTHTGITGPQAIHAALAKKGVHLWKVEAGDIADRYDELIAEIEGWAKHYNPDIGPLNVAPCGSWTNVGMRILQSTLTKPLRCPTPAEGDFLDRARLGALCWALDQTEHGPAASYDIKSAYPYVFGQNTFPTAPGTLRYIDESEFADLRQRYDEAQGSAKYSVAASIPYGLYTVEVNKADLNVDGLAPRFRHSRDGIYPHTDLKAMLHHGVPFTIKGDAMTWTKDELTLKAFNTFTSRLSTARTYAKRRGEKGRSYKSAMNNLVGCLGWRDTRTLIVAPDDNGCYHVPADADVQWMEERRDGKCKFRVTSIARGKYPTTAAYLPIFAWAFARQRLNALMDIAGREHVLRIQTDSMVVTPEGEARLLAHKSAVSDKLGSLHLEWSADRVEIVHCNKLRAWRDGKVVKTVGRW